MMARSYRKINYSLRPAKAVERKMLCEAFRRLYPFGRIETYRYIGLGSIYFSDFNLFHRLLGIGNMLSIEREVEYEECFDFNRPYNISLDCRSTSDVLPSLDWGERAIVWLDYDSKLDESVLSDVATVCARASSGSVLVVTVNAQPESHPDEAARRQYCEETGLEFEMSAYFSHLFKKRVGEKIPPDLDGKMLRGDGLAKACHRIIDSEIREALSDRNAALPTEKKIGYEQCFNFHYRDGARMLTLGGVLFERQERSKFDACSLDGLGFTRPGPDYYEIRVPCLTMAEMRHLNSRLPHDGTSSLALPGVTESEVQQYAEIYRFFPTFAETIFV